MPPPNVVYLPGMFGSRLGIPPAPLFPGFDIWINSYTAVTGLLLQLQLAPDGVSPGPLTRGLYLQPTGLIESAYKPMGDFMRRRGWNVLEAAYDWRMSVRVTSALVWQAIQAAFGSAPIVFVAHSMGGLVARAVYGLMVAAGLDTQVAGMVTLGTPHFGAWDVVRGFFGLPQFYQKLEQVAGLFSPVSFVYRPDFIEVCVASWPGWYECTPWRDSGPLALADPTTAQMLYRVNSYAAGNRYISQDLFNRAVVTQHYLAPAIPFNRMLCIRGNHFATPYEVNPPNPLSADNGYLFNSDGDSIVPLSYQTVQGAVNIEITVAHGEMPLSPVTWNAVRWAVQTLVGPGA